MSRRKLYKTTAIVCLLAVVTGIAVSFILRDKAAPQISFTTIKGETFTTADLHGKVVLVNFWATSCATCIKEMPELISTHQKYESRGYETVAVAMIYDPPNYVIAYAEKNRLPFKVVLDTKGEIANTFGPVQVTPTTFLISKRGEIVKHFIGEPDFNWLHDIVEKELGK
jgi:peroxiredoxin